SGPSSPRSASLVLRTSVARTPGSTISWRSSLCSCLRVSSPPSSFPRPRAAPSRSSTARRTSRTTTLLHMQRLSTIPVPPTRRLAPTCL
ncbi:hypothetical protein FRC00_009139, partial [Tulasnella sp. 408]